METQLYREVWVGPGTKCEEVPKEEVKVAKEKYAKTGECDCKYFYDEYGYSDYHLRRCGICGSYLGAI